MAFKSVKEGKGSLAGRIEEIRRLGAKNRQISLKLAAGAERDAAEEEESALMPLIRRMP